MGIRCYCPNGHKHDVKAEQAGKMGICPICKLRFQIPFGNAQTPTSHESTKPASPQITIEQHSTKPTPPTSQKSTPLQVTPSPSNEQISVKESRGVKKNVTPRKDAEAKKNQWVFLSIFFGLIFVFIFIFGTLGEMMTSHDESVSEKVPYIATGIVATVLIAISVTVVLVGFPNAKGWKKVLVCIIGIVAFPLISGMALLIGGVSLVYAALSVSGKKS